MSEQKATFKDATKLTQWVRYMLYLQITVGIVAIFSGLLEYQLLSDYAEGNYLSQEQAIADGNASDERQGVIGIIQLALFVISGFMILRWIHRANHNARQLGAKDMNFTPGWSIGFYFIPILTLWKPYLAMREIWQASLSPQNWTEQKVGNIVAIWWMLWMGTNALGQLAFRFSNNADDLSDYITVNMLTQGSDILSIPLALVFLVVVNTVSQAQEQTRLQQQHSAG